MNNTCTNTAPSIRCSDARYLIYSMLKKRVEVQPPTGRSSRGVVSRVCRNVFSDNIEVTVNGKVLELKEPKAIVRDGDDVVFLYGDIDLDGIETDEDIFTGLIELYGMSLDEYLSRSEKCPLQRARFRIYDDKVTMKRVFGKHK